MQVDLDDETRHGVDLQQLLLQIDDARVTLRTQGFASLKASPAFFLGIDGTDLDMLIEAIKTTKDVKTLASPKILVLNGQEARIQIGAQLGYLVTTTTQTSTLQQVQFLDVGVVLRVTPQITDDGQILMTVKPEVSTGQINEITGLPEEETTEVETTVMLADGQGMVIGGLIEETDDERQSKIPLLGDLWLIGKLFQRRSVTRIRKEIIIALIPRIVPFPAGGQQGRESVELARATTRLLDGQLNRLDRRAFEPQLPDAMRDPRKLKLRRIPHFFNNLFEPIPHPFEYYFPSVSEQSPWFPGFLYEGTVPFDAFAGQYESAPMLLDVTPGPDTDIGDETLTPTSAVPDIFPYNSPDYE
ncbi:MAG: type II and III secretion system protein [Planctomycetes bacterium]|nr:type II and III secretion system protein [Planctomycetota bacterium]